MTATQTEISFPCVDGAVLPGLLTVPADADGPLPALLMIYEVFGLNAEMRRVARELAAEGWVVLIPDLFARGAKALCVARAFRTMRSGSGPELDDLESARRWLAERPEVAGDRIGAIGFCMGGAFALLLAETGLYRVSAPFYGRTRDLAGLARWSRASAAGTPPRAATLSGSRRTSTGSGCPTTSTATPGPATRS
jgi:carboxymethylenebutenolidase